MSNSILITIQTIIIHNIKTILFHPCSGAWIITGGTNAGVMEFVGEAVRDFSLSSGAVEQKVVAVGIATWGIIDNMDSLMPTEKEVSIL
jgi:hypothetical protein